MRAIPMHRQTCGSSPGMRGCHRRRLVSWGRWSVMFKNLTIMGRLSAAFGVLLVLMLACAGVGVIGQNMLYTTAYHAATNDVQLAQRAAKIDLLVLTERRFEKDAFINLGDGDKLASYKQKWDTARASLSGEIDKANGLELTADDHKALVGIDTAFRAYGE